MRDNSKANATLCRGRWGRLLSPVAAAGYSGCSSVEEFRSLYGDLIFNSNNRERIDIYELDDKITEEKNAARHCG